MTLLFMHMTKTAGGSLKELLKSAAAKGDDIKFYYPEEPDFRNDFDYDPMPRILFGHFVFGTHEQAEIAPDYACFLRQPVARMISHYHHLKNHDTSHIGNRLRSYSGMYEYLRYARHWEFDNFLTRTISGGSNRVRYGDIGVDAYHKARYHLRTYFSYIGLFEEMDESLARLTQLVPNMPTNLPKVNVGIYKPEISDREERLLRELNVFDQMLYDDAVELFHSRAAAQSPQASKKRSFWERR